MTRARPKKTAGRKPARQRPIEIVQWENKPASAKTVRLAINRFYRERQPRLKFALLENGAGVSATEYPKSSEGDVVGPTVFGHAGAASAIAVARFRFNDSAKPRLLLAGPGHPLLRTGRRATAAAPLARPKTIPKPDLAATDCGATTFFAFLRGRDLAFLRHLGRRSPRGRGRGPAAPGEARRRRPAGPDGAERNASEPVALFGPEAVGAGLARRLRRVRRPALPIKAGDRRRAPVAPEVNPGKPRTGPPKAAARSPTPTRDSAARCTHTLILKHPPEGWCAPAWRPSRRLPLRLRPGGTQLPLQGRRAAFAPCARLSPAGSRPGGTRVPGRGPRSSGGLVDPTPAVYRFRSRALRLEASSPRAWRRIIQCPTPSSASRRARAEHQRVGQREAFEAGAEVDRDRGDRQVADRGRPEEAPDGTRAAPAA